MLELPAGTCERTGVREGDRLALESLDRARGGSRGLARAGGRADSLTRLWRLLADESPARALHLDLRDRVRAAALRPGEPGRLVSLTGGRSIVDHGLPHHEAWTVWGAGTAFVDQQWLGQAVLYLVHAAGGFGLLAGFHALLTLGAIAFTLVVARRRGASQRSVLLLLPLSFFCLIGSTWQVRTQSFAYLLFAVCLWLLVDDARRPSSRVFWCLPLLAVWGNLHGSATLGAALVALRGIDRALKGAAPLRNRPRGTRPGHALRLAVRRLALRLLPLDPPQPSLQLDAERVAAAKLGLMTAPFFLLAIGVAWLAGRSRLALTRFERIVLLVTLLAGLSATRNIGWFAFAAIMLCPSAVEEISPPRAAGHALRSRANAIAAAVTLAVLLALLAATVARPASWYTEPYPAAAGDAVALAAARDPGARVYADIKYADWLLWQHPQLAGRLAFDTRFEALSRLRIAEIYNFDSEFGASWRAATRGFRIVVLDRTVSARPIAGLLHEPGTRLVYSGHGVAVLERAAIRR